MTLLAVMAHVSLFATVFKTLPIVDVVASSARPLVIITGLYLLSTSQAAQLVKDNHAQVAAEPSSSKQSTVVESSCRVGPRAQGFSAWIRYKGRKTHWLPSTANEDLSGGWHVLTTSCSPKLMFI